MRGILSSAPLDLIDLLFYFEGLEIIELRLVGLEFCMELILAGFFLVGVRSLCCWAWLFVNMITYRFISFKEHHSSSLITSSKVVACVIKLNSRDDIRCSHTRVS
jgi:hypothetical protein